MHFYIALKHKTVRQRVTQKNILISMLRPKIGNRQTQQRRTKPTYYPIQSSIPHQHTPSNNIISQNPNYHPQNQAQFSNPFRITQIESLKKTNAQLKQKEQLYIQKLMKLQEGLQKQYVEFMTLQQLYTQLLQSYKTKEQEIQRLQQLYKQTERIKYDSLSKIGKKGAIQDSQSIQILIKQNQGLKQSYKQLLSQNQRYKNQGSKLKSELIYLTSKTKMNDSMATLESRVLQQLQQWQKQLDQQKEDKIKLQYENQYLQQRNHDLQKVRDELERIALQKQKQITKLRQQKIQYVRYSSQQRTSRSPSPTKSISESRRRNRMYDELKKQYEQLKKQMEKLKRERKISFARQTEEIKQITRSQGQSLPSPKSGQFFSFTREVQADFINGQFIQNQNMQKQNGQLPNFPPELQIDNLIEQFKK